MLLGEHIIFEQSDLLDSVDSITGTLVYFASRYVELLKTGIYDSCCFYLAITVLLGINIGLRQMTGFCIFIFSIYATKEFMAVLSVTCSCDRKVWIYSSLPRQLTIKFIKLSIIPIFILFELALAMTIVCVRLQLTVCAWYNILY